MSLLNIFRRSKPAIPEVELVELCQVDDSFYDDDDNTDPIFPPCHEPALHHCYVCGARLCKNCADESLYKRNAHVCPKHFEL